MFSFMQHLMRCRHCEYRIKPNVAPDPAMITRLKWIAASATMTNMVFRHAPESRVNHAGLGAVSIGTEQWTQNSRLPIGFAMMQAILNTSILKPGKMRHGKMQPKKIDYP